MLTVTYCHPKEGKVGKPHPCKTFASYLNSEGRREAPGDSSSRWDGNGEQGGVPGPPPGPCHLSRQAGQQLRPEHPSPYFLQRTKAINKVLINKQPWSKKHS